MIVERLDMGGGYEARVVALPWGDWAWVALLHGVADEPVRAGSGVAADRSGAFAAAQAAPRADDGEPVTTAWLEAVIPGFAVASRGDVGGVTASGNGLRLMAHRTDGVWALIARNGPAEASMPCPTRGHVRRLFAAIGADLIR